MLLKKEKSIDVNAKDEYGWTPLHVAALNGKTEIAELLLENRADINGRNYQQFCTETN